MRGSGAIVLAAMLSATWANGAAAVVTPEWTSVGNPGNAADTTTSYGAVAYTYQISKHEVSNSQYAEFLNAKAASDPLGLYSTSMSSNPNGGINRFGSSPGYTYEVKAGQGNQPVVFVNWYDSLRFANWMHNGQGAADTETGAYTLLGGTPTPIFGSLITRNPLANVFLASEDEWYKAAYHQPSGAGGDGDNYWVYPTRSNSDPTSEPPPGGNNSANFFYNGGYAVTGSTTFSSSQDYLTNVGAYTGSASYYGTFDQAGNAWEWNETVISGSTRGIRGSGWSPLRLVLPPGGLPRQHHRPVRRERQHRFSSGKYP